VGIQFNLIVGLSRCLIENPIFKVCIKYTHIFICVSKQVVGFTFVTGPGCVSPLSGPGFFSGMIFIPNVMKILLFVDEVQYSRSS
jgi:hypothetical protein